MSAPIQLVARGTAGSQTLMQLAVRNAGLRVGSRALSTLAAWAIAEATLGRPLGADVVGHGHTTAAVREYSKWWKQSERSTWRDLHAFEKAFGEKTPARLVAAAHEQHAEQLSRKQREAVAQLGGLAIV